MFIADVNTLFAHTTAQRATLIIVSTNPNNMCISCPKIIAGRLKMSVIDQIHELIGICILCSICTRPKHLPLHTKLGSIYL